MMKAFVFFVVCASVDSTKLLKVGVNLNYGTTYGDAAWAALQEWARMSLSNGVQVAFYQANTSQEVHAATTPGANHVFITPYGSSNVERIVGQMNSNFKGPVMVWGGSSDDIWTKNTICYNRHFTCYGTFTVASHYMNSGLHAINEAYDGDLKVLLVRNNDAFSKSVCDGATTKINGVAGMHVQKQLYFAHKSTVNASEVTELKTALAQKPDVLVICGHNGFVERIVHEAKTHDNVPTSILGTNTLTSTAKTTLGNLGSNTNCVMMPTQWVDANQVVNDATGFTANQFREKNAVETYHVASAWAAALSLSNAAEGLTDINENSLKTRLDTMDKNSFYGRLNFDSHGRIQKGMYTQQSHDDHIHVVNKDNMVSCVTGDVVTGEASSVRMVWFPLAFVVLKALHH